MKRPEWTDRDYNGPTPSLEDFLKEYEADDNIWWVTRCGDHQNLFDAATEEIERLREASIFETFREVITSLEEQRNAAQQLAADKANALTFHTGTHMCFNDADLLEYRIRQRQHAARRIRDQIQALPLREWDENDADSITSNAARAYNAGLAAALSILDKEIPHD